MPNRNSHIIAGALSGAAVPLVFPRDAEEQVVDLLGEILLSISAGSVAGILPDVLEPPSSPNHREFFHSFAFGALLGYGGVKTFQYLKDKFTSLDKTQRFFLIVALVVIGAYIIHLVMDSFTAKSLPLF